MDTILTTLILAALVFLFFWLTSKATCPALHFPANQTRRLPDVFYKLVLLISSIAVIPLFYGTFLPKPDIPYIPLYPIWGPCCSVICWN